MSSKIGGEISRLINTELLGDKKRRTITRTTVEGFHKMGFQWVDSDVAHLFMGMSGLALIRPLRIVGLTFFGLVTIAYMMGRQD